MILLENIGVSGNVVRRGGCLQHPATPNRNGSYEDHVMADKALRKIRIEGNIAFVTLTKGYTAVIDAADAPLVGAWNWCAMVKNHTVYARRPGAMDANGNRQTIMMHRVIMNPHDDLQIDHRDGNGLNNRRTNMRVSTNSQNQHNQRTRDDNTSGFKCVNWHKHTGKWQARIMLNGKRHHLGVHATPEAAHKAYCDASTRMHGEFGRFG